MDFELTKRHYFPNVPPEADRMPGVYPKGSSWYTSIYDSSRVKKGLKPRFTVTRATYWEAAEERLKYLGGLLQDAPAPAISDPVAPAATATRAGLQDRKVESLADLLSRRERDDPNLSASDKAIGRTVMRELSEWSVADVSLRWAEARIADWKQALVTPNTIKKKIGCLTRTLNWHIHRITILRAEIVGEQKALSEKPVNPLEHLPKGYAIYRKQDLPVGVEAPKNVSRERRLRDGEEELITATLRGDFYHFKAPTMPHGQPFKCKDQRALLVLFKLIANSAMRLREGYTLTRRQLHFMGMKSQIVLPDTKTDTPRSFPMTPAVRRMMESWLASEVGPELDSPVFPMLWDGSHDEKVLKNLSSELSKRFSRAFRWAGITDLHEHDLRHEATCRWVEMRTPAGDFAYSKSECMSYTGHKTESMFWRYANLRGSDGGARLYGARGAANDEPEDLIAA